MATADPVPVRLRVGDTREQVVGHIELDGDGATVTARWRSRLAECLREVADEIESTKEV